jgi:Raf kinase inhibitor-like YbhB/YbcL family protein
MKRYIICLSLIIIIMLTGCSAGEKGPESTAADMSPQPIQEEGDNMELRSAGIINGIMDAAYGSNGKDITGGVPLRSLPLEITGAPRGAVCFAVYMDDIDSKPLCGFRWVHWMAVNITDGEIPEDFSRLAGDKAVQGTNDFGKAGYGGPTPPDKDHKYEITVYALDSLLPLSEGFTKDEFEEATEGHVLASATLNGIYKK